MPTYTPPAEVAQNAREALAQRDLKPASERGMTLVGLARARQLSERRPISIETIRRMVSYFARHEVDKTGATWDDWGKGRQAWNGWGGDAGRDWAERILKEYKTMNKKGLRNMDVEIAFKVEDGQFYVMDDNGEYKIFTDNIGDFLRLLLFKMNYTAKEIDNELLPMPTPIKAARRHSEQDMKMIRKLRNTMKSALVILTDLGDDGIEDDAGEMMPPPTPAKMLNEHNMVLQESYTAIVSELGKFTQSDAHYMTENPFAATGIKCANCVFYSAGMCSIVEGEIADEAICKLWIIQPEMITETPAEMETEPAVEIDVEVAALVDRNTTPAQREEMPAGDFVIPETRNFPVVTPDDIPAAVSSWGRYEGSITFDVFKRRIIRLAQRKGAEFVAKLPQAWLDEMNAKAAAIREVLNRD